MLIPLAVGVAGALLLASTLPDPVGAVQVIGWWMVVLGVSLVATLGTDRLTRRLLPLAALYKMSLGFPDRAPSRLKVARVQGTVAQLQRWLETVDIESIDDRAKAAEIIISLASALSIHDPRTRGHAERVRAYTDLLSEELGLSEDDANKLRWAALMHDIGKLRVPAEVLNSEQPLTDEQWHLIRRHPIEGMKIAEQLVEWLGPWADAIAHHHERWDGAGYPFGLAGNDIAYGARIVSVADAYDAITALRSYKEAISPEAARRELASHAGEQFDPKVVRAFLNLSIGRIKWIMGPAAWLSQLPFIGGFQRLSRDAATVGLALLLMLGLGGLGVVGDLSSLLGGSEPVASVLGETVTAPDAEPVAAAPATTSTSTPTPTTAPTPTTTTADSTTTTTTPPAPVGPTAAPDSAVTFEDTAVDVLLLANDSAGSSDLDQASIVVAAAPRSGTVVVRFGGIARYTPAPDFHGSDVWSYRLCDLDGRCATAAVEVVVESVNDVPVALVDRASVPEDSYVSVAVLANDGDADGDQLSIGGVGDPAHGRAVVAGDRVEYRPEADFFGLDEFSYQVCDGATACSSGTVFIEVVSVNDRPVAVDDEFVVTAGVPTAIDVLANDFDADGDALSVEILSVVGGLAGPSPSGMVVFDAIVPGVAVIEYQACDPFGACSGATVTVNAIAPPGPETADDEAVASGSVPVQIDVLINDDVDPSEVLSLSVVWGPQHGTVDLVAGGTRFKYRANRGFTGPDSFVYEVCTVEGCSRATVRISVR